MLPSRFVRFALLLATLSIFCVSSARAQSGRGSLGGYIAASITAPKGVAGARVELRELYVWNSPDAKPDTHVVMTDETGNYQIQNVRMGEYALRVTAEGFAPYETTLLISSDMSATLGTLLKKKEGTQRLVESVKIEGNRRMTDEEILSHVKTRPGEPYNAQQVQHDLHALLDLGVLDATQTRVSMQDGVRGGVVVIFTTFELPLIDEVKLTGLRGVTEAEVGNALSEQGIKLAKGDVYDPAQLKRALTVILELLAARRVTGLSVEAHMAISAQETVAIELRFTENH